MVESLDLVADSASPDHDPAGLDQVAVEGMEWLPSLEHHVIGDVDQIVDRSNSGPGQPGCEP